MTRRDVFIMYIVSYSQIKPGQLSIQLRLAVGAYIFLEAKKSFAMWAEIQAQIKRRSATLVFLLYTLRKSEEKYKCMVKLDIPETNPF